MTQPRAAASSGWHSWHSTNDDSRLVLIMNWKSASLYSVDAGLRTFDPTLFTAFGGGAGRGGGVKGGRRSALPPAVACGLLALHPQHQHMHCAVGSQKAVRQPHTQDI
jgi:hypothetical protein